MNKVILMGRLVREPENTVTPSGISVTKFTLAVDRGFKDANGERQTDFINCVSFRNTADFISRYFVKGQLMAVVGSIQSRTWEGQDGRKNFVTEVIVSEAHFTGDKRKNDDAFEHAIAPMDETFINVDDDELPF